MQAHTAGLNPRTVPRVIDTLLYGGAQRYAREARAFTREHFDIRDTVAGLEQLWQTSGD